MSAAADRHRRAAEIELQAAASLGDGGARHALAILRRTELAGRHAFDDGALLQQVERLQQAGHGCRSVGMVARSTASTDRAIAAVARQGLADLIASGQAPARHTTIVDGVEGRSEDGARLGFDGLSQ